jgi:hypothetical protein
MKVHQHYIDLLNEGILNAKSDSERNFYKNRLNAFLIGLKEYEEEMNNQKVIESNTNETNKTKTDTFINGFGEATKRDIETASYNRQCKATERRIMSFIGG